MLPVRAGEAIVRFVIRHIVLVENIVPVLPCFLYLMIRRLDVSSLVVGFKIGVVLLAGITHIRDYITKTTI